MNTHLVKVMASFALAAGLAHPSPASADEIPVSCVTVLKKTRDLNRKIDEMDLTTNFQSISRFKDTLSTRKANEPLSLSRGHSFLNYQINGQSFTKMFVVNIREICSIPDVKKTPAQDITESNDNKVITK